MKTAGERYELGLQFPVWNFFSIFPVRNIIQNNMTNTIFIEETPLVPRQGRKRENEENGDEFS